MMDEIRRMAERIEPGLARRWIKRNWWRCIACAGWVTAGIWIRAAVAAGRPESWPVGGEIIPATACWALAAAVALGERQARKRGSQPAVTYQRRETAFAGCRFRTRTSWWRFQMRRARPKTWKEGAAE